MRECDFPHDCYATYKISCEQDKIDWYGELVFGTWPNELCLTSSDGQFNEFRFWLESFDWTIPIYWVIEMSGGIQMGTGTTATSTTMTTTTAAAAAAAAAATTTTTTTTTATATTTITTKTTTTSQIQQQQQLHQHRQRQRRQLRRQQLCSLDI